MCGANVLSSVPREEVYGFFGFKVEVLGVYGSMSLWV